MSPIRSFGTSRRSFVAGALAAFTAARYTRAAATTPFAAIGSPSMTRFKATRLSLV